MKKKKYRLPDLSRGDPSAENPLPKDFARYVYEELDDRFMELGLGPSREQGFSASRVVGADTRDAASTRGD